MQITMELMGLFVLAVGGLSCAAVPVQETDESASGDPAEAEPAPGLQDGALAAADPRKADELLACAEDSIRGYNESDPDAPGAPKLLAEAADCFAEAGFWGKATFVVRTLETKYPDFEHGHSLEAHRENAVIAIVDRDFARLSPWGKRCVADVDAQGVEASSTEELIAAADCLSEAAYVAATIELRRELERRSDLSEDERKGNAEALAKCEAIVHRAQADLEAG